MPVLPLMPNSSDNMASPMPGGGPGGPGMPPTPGGPMGGGDLSSLLGQGNPSGGMDPVQMGLSMFDRLAQTVADTARMFPGTEQAASQMMEILDQWRQQVLVMMTPQPSAMPGADQMM